MEAARLGLQDFQLGGLASALGRPPPGLGLPPGCEPWGLGPSPLSSLSHSLPGFLSHPQVCTWIVQQLFAKESRNIRFFWEWLDIVPSFDCRPHTPVISRHPVDRYPGSHPICRRHCLDLCRLYPILWSIRRLWLWQPVPALLANLWAHRQCRQFRLQIRSKVRILPSGTWAPVHLVLVEKIHDLEASNHFAWEPKSSWSCSRISNVSDREGNLVIIQTTCLF